MLAIIPLESHGQRNVSRLIDSISNEKLNFEVAKVGTTRILDSGIVAIPKYLVFVNSLSLRSLTIRETQKLISRLVPLLNDITKDWYANVLLYQLTDTDASSLIILESRDEWIAKAKDKDARRWRRYLKSN